ncbi:MAG: sensor histidine kinase, partial [Hyphomonadaceae bacterium]
MTTSESTPAWRRLRAAPPWLLLGAAAGVLAALLVIDDHFIGGVLCLIAGGACAAASLRRAPGPAALRDRDDIIPISLADLAPLLAALPDPALLIGADGRVAGSNDAARQQLQFEAEGLFLSAILRQPALLDAVQAAFDGASRTVEYDTADQVESHIRAYVAPMSWGDERAALIVFHDQTARINTERMRADFLANASHELRTPLASLTLLIETLLGPARDEPAERDRFLGMMKTQADRMRRLIDDLLSLSRIELDEHVPPSDRADLRQVAQEVVDTLAGEAAERRVRLELSAPQTAAAVVGERFQLTQVVQNLADNALKYSAPDGTARIEIGFAANREEAIQLAGRRWEEAGRIALLTPAPAPGKAYA